MPFKGPRSVASLKHALSTSIFFSWLPYWLVALRSFCKILRWKWDLAILSLGTSLDIFSEMSPAYCSLSYSFPILGSIQKNRLLRAIKIDFGLCAVDIHSRGKPWSQLVEGCFSFNEYWLWPCLSHLFRPILIPDMWSAPPMTNR